ncbi:dGTPase [Rhizobium leguminosarum]|uniref:dGTP triphosphohydrolase n=1 Tax=Rhizobium TaxID=379 RepID=UPI00161B189A|nr:MULTISPECIES: dNTP triphosphohydrolase [Rhizobium]MBB4297215.1 dGTPase [Rhizobium leguminosarum]MBB4415359.1 dGTPase [Rhizobium leguminosarum]MBB4431674.1 dGTPase [Rhizobium esperanzae]MBB4539710.1 dGTPase [Rhizobium leguminosarum]MBB5651897.1 dGTPase [Rhizobium leguminosarum]
MPELYSLEDWQRPVSQENPETFRDEARRDYARLIHSASFRRLQGKTQVFPGHESDFFRNRLTHSLEVAQIAKSIAIRLNSTSDHFKDAPINLDVVEFAGLAHDLGHPPFGHNGEEALDECMRDSGGFEGNAQTLRILSTLEKKQVEGDEASTHDGNGSDLRRGLNVTYRSLAAVLKYDRLIPIGSKERPEDKVASPMKGYYKSDEELVKQIKARVLGTAGVADFKTIECSIMDIADDIAYSTYDLEDIFKSGIHGPLDLLSFPEQIYEAVVETINKRIEKQYKDEATRVSVSDIRDVLYEVFSGVFAIGSDEDAIIRNRKIEPGRRKMYSSMAAKQLSSLYAGNGYHRTRFTSKLVQLFLDGVEVVPHEAFPQLHQAKLKIKTFVFVEVLKNITFESVIRSPMLQVVEYRGKDVIKKIFEVISSANGERLMPPDFREIYRQGDGLGKTRTICDFIAGMTDRYAVEFYSRLLGANGMTMHKPL